MDTLKNIVVDIIKAAIIGILAAITIAVIFTAIGFLLHGADFDKILKLDRTAVIIVGALGILCSSGLLLKSHSSRPLKDIEGWKKNFKALNFIYTLLIISFAIIITGGVLDSFLFYIIK